MDIPWYIQYNFFDGGSRNSVSPIRTYMQSQSWQQYQYLTWIKKQKIKVCTNCEELRQKNKKEMLFYTTPIDGFKWTNTTDFQNME